MPAKSLRSLFCLLLLALCSPSLRAQSDPPDETIKIKTDLVILDAQVTDKRNREFIRALKATDFELLEDGVKQQIEYFSQDKLPLSVVLLIDVSASVKPVLEEIRKGALAALSRLKPEDEIALMVFAGYTELAQDFTKDRQLILDKLGAALSKTRGGTRIHEAIGKAARQMRYATNPNSRRVIITITDNQGAMDRRNDSISEEEVRQTVMESGATVYAILVRSLLNVGATILMQHPMVHDQFKGTSVNPYVQQSGGDLSSASKDEINARLGELFDRLRNCYSLGYTSTNQTYNGKFRRIRLTLTPAARKRLGGEIVVRTRDGYYANDHESEEMLAAAEEAKPEAPATANAPQSVAATGASTGATASAPPNAMPSAQPETAAPDVAQRPVETTAANAAKPPLHPWAAMFRRERPPNPYAHLQMIDVLAVNKKTGAVMENLTPADIKLDDKGMLPPIAHFSRGQLPLSIVLLIDVNGRTPVALSALRRNVSYWLRRLKAEDEVALMAFGNSTALIQDFTKDRKLVALKLRDLVETARQRNVGPGQMRAQAVFAAAEHLDKFADPIARRVVITITDDAQNFSLPMDAIPTLELLLDSGTAVYALVTPGEKPSRTKGIMRRAAYSAIIGLGNPVVIVTQVATMIVTEAVMDQLMKDRAFNALVQRTGGGAGRVTAEDAPEKMAALLDNIHSRYVVGFAPAIATRPATWVVVGKRIKDAAKHERFRPLKLTLHAEGQKEANNAALVSAQGYFARRPVLEDAPTAEQVSAASTTKRPPEP